MRSELETLYFALLEAWNRRDAAGMSALYAKNGVQIGFDGSRADGEAQIHEHLAPVFSDHPTARFVAKVRDCRMLRADTAMLTAVAGMLPPGEDRINPETNVLQTLVASRADDQWRAVLFQNTPAAWHGREGDRENLTAELQSVADSGT